MATHHFIPARDPSTFTITHAHCDRCGMIVPCVAGKLGDSFLKQQCQGEDFGQASGAQFRSTPRSLAEPFRHQCLIYEGAPSLQLPALAATVHRMLGTNYRCLYLNSPEIVARMSSYLAAQGIDVAHEVSKTSLMLSSDLSHLAGGNFDVAEMIGTLEDAIVQALRDGFTGLWATGDISWEFGNQSNLQKLLTYERQLEELFRRQPQLCGICQYHGDSLSPEIVSQSLLTHRAVFIDETLSRINPLYIEA